MSAENRGSIGGAVGCTAGLKAPTHIEAMTANLSSSISRLHSLEERAYNMIERAYGATPTNPTSDVKKLEDSSATGKLSDKVNYVDEIVGRIHALFDRLENIV